MSRGKRHGPTKRGQKPEIHPIFHGSAALATIASDFGGTWEMSGNMMGIFIRLGVCVHTHREEIGERA
jgi:hypothetical protein